MRIKIKDGKTVHILDMAERRVLEKAKVIAKSLGDHSGGLPWTKAATEVELGIDTLLESITTERPR